MNEFNRIMVNAELNNMSTEQLRDLQELIPYNLNIAFKKQDTESLAYFQELELLVAARIDYLEFGG